MRVDPWYDGTDESPWPRVFSNAEQRLSGQGQCGHADRKKNYLFPTILPRFKPWKLGACAKKMKNQSHGPHKQQTRTNSRCADASTSITVIIHTHTHTNHHSIIIIYLDLTQWQPRSKGEQARHQDHHAMYLKLLFQEPSLSRVWIRLCLFWRNKHTH